MNEIICSNIIKSSNKRSYEICWKYESKSFKFFFCFVPILFFFKNFIRMKKKFMKNSAKNCWEEMKSLIRKYLYYFRFMLALIMNFEYYSLLNYKSNMKILVSSLFYFLYWITHYWTIYLVHEHNFNNYDEKSEISHENGRFFFLSFTHALIMFIFLFFYFFFKWKCKKLQSWMKIRL